MLHQQQLIRTIETLSFKALPALENRHYDGWVLRYAEGYTRRANSVNPIYASTEDIELKIRQCEIVYTMKNLPTIFKLTDAVYPENLDNLLEMQGYRKEATTNVLVSSIIGRGQSSPIVDITEQFSEAWMEDFARLNNINSNHAVTLSKMLILIPTQTGYLRLMDKNGEVIGVALGVVEEEWMGVFDVVVHPDQRGKGYGRMIMEALFAWGEAQGASNTYLQVQADNTIAKHLYHSLGYVNQYQYWYRVKCCDAVAWRGGSRYANGKHPHP